MNRPPQCLDCKFANWQRTSKGRLHPSGDGRCTWKFPTVHLPVSMYFTGFSDPRPTGGHINRKDEWRQCPQFQPRPKP